MVLACRLAKQVSVFYEEVHRLLTSAPLASHFDKSWTAHVAVKTSLYDVESQLQNAEALHADDEIASEIARLQVGEPGWVQLHVYFFICQVQQATSIVQSMHGCRAAQ